MKKGDKYKAIIEIVKIKNDIPTVIKLGGRKFVMEHPNQFRGKKK